MSEARGTEHTEHTRRVPRQEREVISEADREIRAELPGVDAADAAKLHAEVEVGVGLTVGLGKFEFYRIDVRLRVPTRANPTSWGAAYDAVKTWCDERVNAAAQEAIQQGTSR